MRPKKLSTKNFLKDLDSCKKSSVFYNLTEPALMQKAVERGEGVLGIGGALLVETGKHTGRSPKDKFIVKDRETKSRVWWEGNGSISPANFEKLHTDILKHMKGRDYFVQDLYACADRDYRINIRLVNELAWHALFIRHLLRCPDNNDLEDFQAEYTIINCPSFKVTPELYGVRSETVIAINFSKKLVLVAGTEYAGENKKGVFTLLNYILPDKGVMPMHCSANHATDESENVTLFFGLSGTGKTTLSQDPLRILIGDDEHGWANTGIFNFEGGCYAKTINLSPDAEPEIFSAMTKFSTVVENMRFDNKSLQLDYKDDGLTPNMRSAYPLDFIANASKTGTSGPPKNIILLTCDAFGVLPPIARLSPEQAVYHFLSGFTSKAPGTERGVTEPQPTFSACFGAPFLPLRPEVYGEIFRNKIREGKVNCWLVNTGWIGGAYGDGKRIPIEETRAILSAIHKGLLDKCNYRYDETFKFRVPEDVPGVNKRFMNPRNAWRDKASFDRQAQRLVNMFVENFRKYKLHVDKSVIAESL